MPIKKKQDKENPSSRKSTLIPLCGPVCLFWHKRPPDRQLRFDIPPAATRHGWLAMKNISPSSWLHTRHTEVCSHTEQDLWHRSYIRLSSFKHCGNTVAHLSFAALLLQTISMVCVYSVITYSIESLPDWLNHVSFTFTHSLAGLLFNTYCTLLQVCFYRFYSR